MNCEQCSWYVTRDLTPYEVQYLKYNPDKLIDRRTCALGGCDGSMFLGKDRGKDQK